MQSHLKNADVFEIQRLCQLYFWKSAKGENCALATISSWLSWWQENLLHSWLLPNSICTSTETIFNQLIKSSIGIINEQLNRDYGAINLQLGGGDLAVRWWESDECRPTRGCHNDETRKEQDNRFICFFLTDCNRIWNCPPDLGSYWNILIKSMCFKKRGPLYTTYRHNLIIQSECMYVELVCLHV